MVTFENKKEVTRIEFSRQAALLNINHDKNKRIFYLSGPRGSGKTKIAQDYVRSHANAFYLSFDKLSEREALDAFRLQYVPDAAAFSDWTEAAAAFISQRNKRTTFLIFENESSAVMQQCKQAFRSYIYQTDYVRACEISLINLGWSERSVEVNYKTLADYFCAFPEYSRQDIIRLHALTGGIMCIAKELDEKCSFEENVNRLLAYDSAFTNTLPAWLAQSFRSPESYYPIFKSIAGGHHRLGEIAKDICFPNNKCGKYLEALIQHGYVRALKTESGKQSTYHLANSYFASWARYACGKQAMQVAEPDRLLAYVMNDIDSAVALPAFQSACKRFIDLAQKDYLKHYRESQTKSIQKSMLLDTEEVQKVLVDLFVETDDATYVFLCPHTMGARYIKEEIEKVYYALESINAFYNTHIIIFSIERFSDWCVHEAKRNPWLHEVTLERLRY